MERNKTFGRKTTLVTCTIFFLCAIYLILSGWSVNTTIHIFSDLEECRKIVLDNDDGVIITEYELPDKDKYLKDLAYNNFFGCDYDGKDFNFELFAYEFEDDGIAKKYFTNITGKNSDLDTNFSSVSGMSFYRRVVIDGSKAYIVHASKKDAEKAVELINTVFTKKLYESVA